MPVTARYTFSMPAATPRKNSTIIPHGCVPNHRSIAQPKPVETPIATTSSMPMRTPRPSPCCRAERSATAGCLRTRSARALSISSPSRASGSGGLLSLIREAQPSTSAPAVAWPERGEHNDAPEECQRGPKPFEHGLQCDVSRGPRPPHVSSGSISPHRGIPWLFLLFLLFLQEIYCERRVPCRRNPENLIEQRTIEQRGTTLWLAVLVMHLMYIDILYRKNSRPLRVVSELDTRRIGIRSYQRNYCL